MHVPRKNYIPRALFSFTGNACIIIGYLVMGATLPCIVAQPVTAIVASIIRLGVIRIGPSLPRLGSVGRYIVAVWR